MICADELLNEITRWTRREKMELIVCEERRMMVRSLVYSEKLSPFEFLGFQTEEEDYSYYSIHSSQC